ncbi:MAG: PhzF family phenazine biosynthesis protein [Chloroflexi bacterium]|nr:PhzF family phenazine biosynthesis protein [Chloroflexota bacterium]
MRKIHFHLVDVFTNQAFGGNQLAVFEDGRGLATETMQAIAREINFSETTFVLPPDDPNNHYRVRIFTPSVEMPVAGHPTIGTAFVLAHTRMIDTSGQRSALRLEEQAGVIPVLVELHEGAPTMITMQQSLPTFGPRFNNVPLIADMLSLNAEEIESAYPLEVVSCGVPFLFVPLRSLVALQRCKLRLDVWERALRDFAAPHVFVFARGTVTAEGTVHSRMFAPALGIIEDPATGAASGPLGCYLVKHKLVSDNPARIVSEQGFEIARPSLIRVEIERMGSEITRVSVGGQCVAIGEGDLYV